LKPHVHKQLFDYNEYAMNMKKYDDFLKHANLLMIMILLIMMMYCYGSAISYDDSPTIAQFLCCV